MKYAIILQLLLSLSITGTMWAKTTSTRSGNGYIDTHVHLREMKGDSPQGMMKNAKSPGRKQSMSSNQSPWGRGGSSQDQEASATINLKQKMDRMGVSQALVVVVPNDNNSHEAEYQEMRNLVSRFSDRLKLMAGGARLSDLLYDTAPSQVTISDIQKFRSLAQAILDEGAVGFGEMISYHLCMAKHHSFKYATADHPLFLLLADIAAENNVPIDLHMEAIENDRPMPQNLKNACSQNPSTLTATIPALKKLLAHNRKANIVWQHIGWDNTGDMKPSLLRALLKENPNLYLGLRVEKREAQVGNGGPMPNRLVDRTGRIDPVWHQLIQDYPDRFVIGSDEFFFARTDERPNQSFVETFSILDQLDKTIAKQVGRENAIRIYNLY